MHVLYIYVNPPMLLLGTCLGQHTIVSAQDQLLFKIQSPIVMQTSVPHTPHNVRKRFVSDSVRFPQFYKYRIEFTNNTHPQRFLSWLFPGSESPWGAARRAARLHRVTSVRVYWSNATDCYSILTFV